MEYQAFVRKVNDTVQVTEKFKKRELIVTDDAPSYPQIIMFEFTQDKCSLLDDINGGDEVKITFNLNGREYVKDGVTRVFNSLKAWRIEKIKAGTFDNEKVHPNPETIVPTPDDGLPF